MTEHELSKKRHIMDDNLLEAADELNIKDFIIHTGTEKVISKRRKINLTDNYQEDFLL